MKPLTEITPGILTSRSIIRFQDCDPFGHLNNGRYLDYFMNAREDQIWRAYDLNIYAYSRTTGLGWVVSQNQIAYVRPALLMEEVGMESQLLSATSKYLHIEMRMYDEARKLKSLLWAHFIHVDIRTARSTAHSPELEALFSIACQPISETDFNERLKVLNV